MFVAIRLRLSYPTLHHPIWRILLREASFIRLQQNFSSNIYGFFISFIFGRVHSNTYLLWRSLPWYSPNQFNIFISVVSIMSTPILVSALIPKFFILTNMVHLYNLFQLSITIVLIMGLFHLLMSHNFAPIHKLFLHWFYIS